FAVTGPAWDRHSWVWLECNPNGQWGWLPDSDDIADAFAHSLTTQRKQPCPIRPSEHVNSVPRCCAHSVIGAICRTHIGAERSRPFRATCSCPSSTYAPNTNQPTPPGSLCGNR